MSVVFAVFCGLIQGLTEFLPVSSSGHLNLLQNFFGMENIEQSYMTFDILLHLGTLIAVFVVYWRDIFALIPAFFTGMKKLLTGHFRLSDYTENERFVWFVILATLPLVLAMFLTDWVEALGQSSRIIGLILIFNGLVLFLSDRFARGDKELPDVKPRHALIVGLCQLCAVVPGLSRSGSTITGGLTQGFSRELAVKFSFILSIPAILGANILSVPDILRDPVPAADRLPYLLGMITAAVAGVAAMKLLTWISRKNNFRVFSYYCFAVGLAAVIFG